MAKKEGEIIAGVLLRYSRKGWVLWRNNTGTLFDRTGRPVSFGLKGSADIIGLRPVQITADMVGQTIGQFVAIEIKTGRQKLRPAQKSFCDMVLRLNGLYRVCSDNGR